MADGRYPMRRPGAKGTNAIGVLVVQTAGAPAAAGGRPRRRPKPRPVEPGDDPTPVPVTRLTVISAEPLEGEDGAARWFDTLRGDSDALEREVEAGLATANRALHAHAVGTQDTALTQLGRSAPLVVRVGYGTGDGLADGRWSRAVEVPAPAHRARRAEALRPAERIASVLGGHEQPDACETLLLRARSDLDAGRSREAALELRSGLEALLAEIGPAAGPDQAEDLADIEERRKAVGAIAEAALRAEPGTAELDEVAEALRVCERVLRRRRILGPSSG